MVKVIQWCTGVAGQHAARAVIAHPDFDLVGCYVMSEAKAGKDVGEICGVAPTGVLATTDKEAIYAMEADVVLYMALEEFGVEKPVEELCRLLASGKNVVSTATTSLIYPKAAGAGVLERLEAACREGGTSFHATGIHPGWGGDILPLTLSAVTGRIDRLVMQEIMDYSTYPAPVAMFQLMGFGGPAHNVPPTDVPIEGSGSFGAPLLMIADALGATIEKFVFQMQTIPAPEDMVIAAGTLAKGTVAGKRYSFTAIIDGEPKLTIEHVTRAGAPVPADWPEGRGWYVRIEGAPSWKLSAEIGLDGQDNNDAGCLAGAMHAIHAIPYVLEAEPGVRTLTDLPMIMGRGILGKGVSGSPGF
ncbi:dihydrodipicolinate reductase [Novosphingobium bradum]|uniref:Dihydrodipicolinate reductase n=1 Tax=Novosphingobium bradum TaxID=1737444 RepID=A0ABV7INZ0_9SPHN